MAEDEINIRRADAVTLRRLGELHRSVICCYEQILKDRGFERDIEFIFPNELDQPPDWDQTIGLGPEVGEIVEAIHSHARDAFWTAYELDVRSRPN